MIHGGEDPKFIARRMLIFASEDVATPTRRRCSSRTPRSRPPSRSAGRSAASTSRRPRSTWRSRPRATRPIGPSTRRSHEVRTGPARAVPNHLRDRHRPGAETYGPYRYPHDYPDARVEQRYLPDGLERGAFFQPSPRGWEAERAARLGGCFGRQRLFGGGTGRRPSGRQRIGGVDPDSAAVGRWPLCYTGRCCSTPSGGL